MLPAGLSSARNGIATGANGFCTAESIWRVAEIARLHERDIGVGQAAYAAMDHRAHLATMRPDVFGRVLLADWSILDLR